jgi:hypothetical protein
MILVILSSFGLQALAIRAFHAAQTHNHKRKGPPWAADEGSKEEETSRVEVLPCKALAAYIASCIGKFGRDRKKPGTARKKVRGQRKS